ncbi:MAG: AbrB/MazE/SpoVT family DNA-binding domain-containing protein [Oscillospiraceae bacterium]|nr:AbrB/MazE/SpoVT family DNA-binding domain-containing protein [Oscillospiraceae bacterium]
MTSTKILSVNRWGNGWGIRLPKEFVENANINENSQVKASMTEKGLLITHERKHIPLAERFKNYTGDYKGEIIDWGEDVGGEICD